MAHLVDCVNPLTMTTPIGAIIGAINTYQLHSIGKRVQGIEQAVDGIAEDVKSLMITTNHLVGLATGTMLLSGLTLSIGTAGFAFLNRKLNKVDERLQQVKRKCEQSRDFLLAKQRAELTNALSTLRSGFRCSVRGNSATIAG